MEDGGHVELQDYWRHKITEYPYVLRVKQSIEDITGLLGTLAILEFKMAAIRHYEISYLN